MDSVLLVDDDKLICEDIRAMLEPEFNVLGVCGNGQSALAMLEKCHCDIVLTDISMPIMDGVTLVKEAHRRWPQMLLVVLSNYDDFTLVKEAMRYGAFDYLLKYDVDASQLSHTLRRIDATWRECLAPLNTSPHDDQDDHVRVEILNTLQYINEHFQENLSLVEVAAMVGFSRNYFCMLFKQETGKNFVDYLNNLRIDKAKGMLQCGNMKVYEVAERVGFRDYRYFCRIFRQYTGRQPASLKSQRVEKRL